MEEEDSAQVSLGVKYAKMDLVLLDTMGDDITVVNAARCSFGRRKKSKTFEEVQYGFKDDMQTKKISVIDEADKKLVNYLAKHGHWSPFAHCSIQFHIKAPIFVARQLVKHQVGLVWNEISRRYVDSDPEFYEIDEWRLRAEKAKQGSSDKKIKIDVSEFNKACLEQYRDLLKQGVAPEMARSVLPANVMTEWYWSGSLYAFARVCKLRLPKDAQEETRIIAQMINDQCKKLFPVSWEALMC